MIKEIELKLKENSSKISYLENEIAFAENTISSYGNKRYGNVCCFDAWYEKDILENVSYYKLNSLKEIEVKLKKMLRIARRIEEENDAILEFEGFKSSWIEEE